MKTPLKSLRKHLRPLTPGEKRLLTFLWQHKSMWLASAVMGMLFLRVSFRLLAGSGERLFQHWGLLLISLVGIVVFVTNLRSRWQRHSSPTNIKGSEDE